MQCGAKIEVVIGGFFGRHQHHVAARSSETERNASVKDCGLVFRVKSNFFYAERLSRGKEGLRLRESTTSSRTQKYYRSASH